MSFEVGAEAYGEFMGRWSEPLSDAFLARSAVVEGSVLDVGCGPGALTERLVGRFGVDGVRAVDPSTSFVAAARGRFPGLEVVEASAERLPYPDATFSASLAQLVVHFMADPVAGLAEMARVTRPGGVVAACVWDFGGERAPLSPFWRAVEQSDPSATDESALPGAREHDLARLAAEAGLTDVVADDLAVTRSFATYDDWWRPFTLGVGPAGAYVAGLGDAAREALRTTCEGLLPPAPFTVDAHAWCVVAQVRAD